MAHAARAGGVAQGKIRSTEEKKTSSPHSGSCACSFCCSPSHRRPRGPGRGCCADSGRCGRRRPRPPEGATTSWCLRRRVGQLQRLASLNTSFRQCSVTPAASLELCGRGRTRVIVPSSGIGTRSRPARQWPSQPGLREAPQSSQHSGRRPAVRSTIAAPVGALDADGRAWREGLQSRGRWSTPRRARAASAAQRARCMGGRSIAFRRPTLTIDYRRLL